MSNMIWVLLFVSAMLGGVVTTIVLGLRKGKSLPPPKGPWKKWEDD